MSRTQNISPSAALVLSYFPWRLPRETVRITEANLPLLLLLHVVLQHLRKNRNDMLSFPVLDHLQSMQRGHNVFNANS